MTASATVQFSLVDIIYTSYIPIYNNSHLKFYLSKDPTGNNHGVVCDIFSEFMFVTLSGHETNFRQSKCKMQFLNYDKPY